jgi:hypothetical protein
MGARIRKGTRNRNIAAERPESSGKGVLEPLDSSDGAARPLLGCRQQVKRSFLICFEPNFLALPPDQLLIISGKGKHDIIQEFPKCKGVGK